MKYHFVPSLTCYPERGSMEMEEKMFDTDDELTAEAEHALRETIEAAEIPPLEVLQAMATLVVRLAADAHSDPGEVLDWFVRQIDLALEEEE